MCKDCKCKNNDKTSEMEGLLKESINLVQSVQRSEIVDYYVARVENVLKENNK